MGKTQVYEWARKFREGREKTKDDRDKSGRKPYVLSPGLLQALSDYVDDDRRVTLEEIAEEFGIGQKTAWRVMHESLEMTKVSARWVPRKLESSHLAERVKCSKKGLRLYRKKDSNFLELLVTGDETWIPFRSVESKLSSQQWKHKDSPTPRKFKVQPSAGKMMYIIFWDCDGILLSFPVPKGETVTASLYCQALEALNMQIRMHRPPEFQRNFFLLHDNPQVTRHTKHRNLSVSSGGKPSIIHPTVPIWRPRTSSCSLR